MSHEQDQQLIDDPKSGLKFTALIAFLIFVFWIGRHTAPEIDRTVVHTYSIAKEEQICKQHGGELRYTIVKDLSYFSGSPYGDYKIKNVYCVQPEKIISSSGYTIE